MKSKCAACKTKVEIVSENDDLVQLDPETVNEGEVPDAVGYLLHQDDTATNIRRQDADALAEGKKPKKIGKRRVEHRNLCPDMLTVTMLHQLPPRLRKIVEERAKDHVVAMKEPQDA